MSIARFREAHPEYRIANVTRGTEVLGAGPDVVRLSIGLEDKEDIIADLEQALNN